MYFIKIEKLTCRSRLFLFFLCKRKYLNLNFVMSLLLIRVLVIFLIY